MFENRLQSYAKVWYNHVLAVKELFRYNISLAIHAQASASAITPSRTTTTPTLHTLVRSGLAISKSMAAQSFMASFLKLRFTQSL
jgi:hypothetical protein